MVRTGFRNRGGTDVHDQVTRVGRAWWWPAIFGAISIVAGVLALAWPGPTLVVLAVLFGIELIVWGIFRLVGAFTFGDESGGARVLWAILGVLSLLSGVLGIIAGLILLFWPAISILTLAFLAGIWLIVLGITQFSLAMQLRRG